MPALLAAVLTIGPPAVAVGAGTPAEPQPATASGAAAGPDGTGEPGVIAEAGAAIVPDAVGRPTREELVADLLADGPDAADLVWLEADGGRFIAFHRRVAPTGRALLVVPGPGACADGEPLLQALATAPLAGGWSTLVLQMPLEAPSESAVCARLRAGIGYLREAGVATLGVVAVDGHGGSVVDCLAAAPPEGLAGVAVLGRWAGPGGEPPGPLLELVPALDAEALRLAGVRERRWSATPRPSHRQDRLAGIGPRFTGAEEEAAKRVRGWLEHRTASSSASR